MAAQEAHIIPFPAQGNQQAEIDNLRKQVVSLQRKASAFPAQERQQVEIDNLRKQVVSLQRKVSSLQSELKYRKPIGDNSKTFRQRASNAEKCIKMVHLLSMGLGQPHQHPWLRGTVWNAQSVDGLIPCCHCGKMLSFDDFTVEHLKPKKLGGSDDLSNLRGACYLCNVSRPLEDISHKFNEVDFSCD